MTQKLLFIHSGGLGDVILLSPALELLHQSGRDKYHTSLLVEKRAHTGSQEFFAKSAWIGQIRSFDFKGGGFSLSRALTLLDLIRGYDAVIASGSSPLVSFLLWLSGARRRIGFRSAWSFLLTDPVPLNRQQYASLMWGELVRPLVTEIPGHLRPMLPDESFEGVLPSPIVSRYILIHPGVSQLSLQKGITKSPRLSFWLTLIERLCLKNPDRQIVLIGGPDEREFFTRLSPTLKPHPNLVDLSQKRFSLMDLANLIARSEKFICVDSAPMHLGVAVNAQLEVIFGPTDPEKLLPANSPKIKVHKTNGLLCQPCLWEKRSRNCKTSLCLDLLDPRNLSQEDAE